jgi:hypothetical protein
MKRLPLICVVLLLAACARDKKATTAAVKASAAPDVAIAPSDAQGIYLDAARAKLFQKSGHILEDDCTASADQRVEAVKIFVFTPKGIFAYGRNTDVKNPDSADLYYSGDHKGRLTPQREELKSDADHSFAYSLHKKGKHVHVRFLSKDLKTGASSETDQALAQISEATARDFLAQESACATRAIADGRITKLALGSGHVAVGSANGTPSVSYLGNGTPDFVRCETGGNELVIAAGSKFAYSLPSTDPLDGTAKTVKASDSSLHLQFDNIKLTAEDCTARAKRTGNVLEAIVQCGAAGSQGNVEISIACPRQAAAAASVRQ